MEKWEQLEQYICDQLKEIDPTIRRTPGSGNGHRKGDVTCQTNVGLHLEAKQREMKNVWQKKWLAKCASEIPLHVDKIPIVVTQDEKEERVVHLKAEDFFNLYINYWRLKNE
jgi:hypothetical protein